MLLSKSGRRAGRIRAALRSTTAIGALVALELIALGATRSAWRDVVAPRPADLDEALVLVVTAACALVGGWVVLGTTVAVVAHLPGQLGDAAQRWSRTLAPAATRRVAAVLVGAALGGSLAPGTAVGSPGGGAPEHTPGFIVTQPVADTSTSRAAPVVEPVASAPGWTPSRPVHPSAPATRLVTTGSTPPTSDVVVHRGDSLWSIARRHLGPGATDAEVAAVWPHWYATNRAVIGPDPDLLHPGQVLRAPEPGRPSDQTVGAHP